MELRQESGFAIELWFCGEGTMRRSELAGKIFISGCVNTGSGEPADEAPGLGPWHGKCNLLLLVALGTRSGTAVPPWPNVRRLSDYLSMDQRFIQIGHSYAYLLALVIWASILPFSD